MLHIQKGNPWLLWPNNVCDTLPENPANKILNGNHKFELYIDLRINKVDGEIGTIFTLLPHYTAMDIYEGRLLFTMMDINKKSTYWDLPVPIYDGIRMRIHWIHTPNNKFNILINNDIIHTVDLSSVGFDVEPNPHIIFGAGNFPKNEFHLNYTDIELYEFKIINDKSNIICHHKFEEFIYDKSVDITDNCNFINEL
jgi:hypothetical protein